MSTYFPPQKVQDGDDLRRALVGRTIRYADRDDRVPGNGGFELDQNAVKLWLDDGTVIRFSSWGYDASGCMTEIVKQPRSSR